MTRLAFGPWWILAWSQANGMRPVPYELYIMWHFQNLLPTECA